MFKEKAAMWWFLFQRRADLSASKKLCGENTLSCLKGLYLREEVRCLFFFVSDCQLNEWKKELILL